MSPIVHEPLVVFTPFEKSEELRAQLFRSVDLAHVDFSHADLSFARFEDADLTTCNFTRADLRGVTFVRCDLRWSTFGHTRLGKNHFEQAFFAGCNGLDNKQRRYIERHGGSFSLDRPRLDRE